jgi:SpoVK/Ycf46/Vps4 family AAA+-type ATPase
VLYEYCASSLLSWSVWFQHAKKGRASTNLLCSNNLARLLLDLYIIACEQAKEMESKCAVLFFDEIDALGQSRGEMGTPSSEQSGGGGDACSRRILAELLIQLNRINSSQGNIGGDEEEASVEHHHGEKSLDNTDAASIDSVYEDYEQGEQQGYGAAPQDDCEHMHDEEEQHDDSQQGSSSSRGIRVIVVAATNRPEDCDPALLRRFGIRVLVGPPTKRNRKKMLERFLEGIDTDITRAQLDSIAVATDGWTGSDLESMTREAAMAPIRECIRYAAKLKRRGVREKEQRGGDSSGQNDDDHPTMPAMDPDTEARDNLLEHFQSLRPVSLDDFKSAMAFCWSGNQHGSDALNGGGQSGGFQSPEKRARYDSSSDEEELL